MSDKQASRDVVPVSIDKRPHKSPNPTTGAALYALGAVAEAYDLFRETRGQGDDELIARNDTVVNLQPGEQFFSVQNSLNPGVFSAGVR